LPKLKDLMLFNVFNISFCHEVVSDSHEKEILNDIPIDMLVIFTNKIEESKEMLSKQG
jgi:hypothetical protein